VSKRRVSSYQDLSSYQWSLELAQTGSRIVYLHEAQYPLLEVEVVLRERSREQMGDLELTILKLLKTGPLELPVLAALLGFSEPRLHNLIKELQGRSLIAINIEAFYLTELGRLSVEQGFEVLEVKRALLLCGITGHLMPASTYEQPLSTVEELAKRTYGRVLIDETKNVPTQHLDITRLVDKRAYNLPDEATEIVDIVDYEPRFLRGILALYETPDKKQRGEFCFANTSIDWLENHDLIKFIEPIEWRHGGKKSRDDILAEICQALQQVGCEVAASRYDEDDNPVVELIAMSDKAYKTQISTGVMRPLLFFVGTQNHPAIPIFNFPRSGSLLSGHPLRLIATNAALQKEIDILRTASNALDEFYDDPSNRQGSVRDYALEMLRQADYKIKELSELVTRLGLRRFYSLVDKEGL